MRPVEAGGAGDATSRRPRLPGGYNSFHSSPRHLQQWNRSEFFVDSPPMSWQPERSNGQTFKTRRRAHTLGPVLFGGLCACNAAQGPIRAVKPVVPASSRLSVDRRP